MPNFKYTARDKQAKQWTGTIEADSKDEAVEQLKEKGYTPVFIEEDSAGFSFGLGFLLRFRRVKPEDLIMFTRQLVTLQTAGLPLLASLQAIKEQTESKVLKTAITYIIFDVESGSSFSDALAKHPNIFNELYVNMVKAGEASGTLDNILERLAVLGEYQMQTRAKIRSATMYPLIVIVTLIIAFLVVVTFVLPRFADLFSRFNVALPVPTRILLAINSFVRDFWYLLLVVVIGAAFSFSRYINTKHGRFVWDAFKLKIPIFGPLILKITMSRFARTAGALIESGLPMLQVLEMSSKTAGNAILSKALEDVRRSVNEGKSMNEPMKANKLFPPIVTQMVAVGENTGKLDQLLMHISNYYDSQVDYALKNLTSAIEPILIFCLGSMVLVMALAIFLPMWNMMQVFRR